MQHLETLRRSLVMAPPNGKANLTNADAAELVETLQSAQRRLDRLLPVVVDVVGTPVPHDLPELRAAHQELAEALNG